MHLHVVIEEGMQLSRTQLNMMQADKTKVASFRTGNDYTFLSEQILFRSKISTMKDEKKAHTTLFDTTGYDAIWCIPSFCKHSGFLSTLFRSKTVPAPYVWSPYFFDGTTRLLHQRRSYTNRGKEKVIAMFEPNLNVVKTSIIPVYIAESLFRKKPDMVHKVIVTNSADLIAGDDASAEFIKFAGSLDLLDAGKIAFEGRYKTPFYLSRSVDVVISHQWSNELNFLYLDVLHARYPLIHNSPYFKDCGYYYEGHDVEAGARALELALTTHDNNIKEYNAKADACIYKYHTRNPKNTAEFETLMRQLVQRPAEPGSKASSKATSAVGQAAESKSNGDSANSKGGDDAGNEGDAAAESEAETETKKENKVSPEELVKQARAKKAKEKELAKKEAIKLKERKRDESGYVEGMNDIVLDTDSDMPIAKDVGVGDSKLGRPRIKDEYIGPPVDSATGKAWIQGDEKVMSHEEAAEMYKRIAEASKGRFRRVGDPIVRSSKDMVVLELTKEVKAAGSLEEARAAAIAASEGSQ
eukprot:gene16997-14057_t